MICSITTNAQFDILDKAKEKLKEKTEEAITPKEETKSTEQKQEEPQQEEEAPKAKTPDENPAPKQKDLRAFQSLILSRAINSFSLKISHRIISATSPLNGIPTDPVKL